MIAASGVNGTLGYVRSKDLDSNPNTPEEAIEQQLVRKSGTTIPLYEKDGETIIGSFKIS